jgi:hypothetical protein
LATASVKNKGVIGKNDTCIPTHSIMTFSITPLNILPNGIHHNDTEQDVIYHIGFSRTFFKRFAGCSGHLNQDLLTEG